MIPTSDKWKNTIASDNVVTTSYIELQDGTKIDDLSNLVSWKITHDTLVNNHLIGSATIKILEVDLINNDNHYQLDDTAIKLYSGLVYPDETTEYILLGTFYVYEHTYDDVNNISNIKCRDKMMLYDVQYETLEDFVFPMHYQKYVSLISEVVGVEYNTGRNLITTSSLSAYASYLTSPIVEEGGRKITTTYLESYNSNLFVMRTSAPNYGKGVYTMSGYIRVDGNIPSQKFFTGKISTYQGVVLENYYDPSSGYFYIVQEWTNNTNAWVIHAPTARVPYIPTEVTLIDWKFEHGNTATPWTSAWEDNDITNGQFILQEPYVQSGGTFRDCMAIVAEFLVSNAMIVQDKLEFRALNSPTTHLSVTDYFELKINDTIGAYNVVVLGRGDLNDNIYYPIILPPEPIEFRIDNNEILDKSRELFIVSVFNKINGFSFTPFEMTMLRGRPDLVAMDKIEFTDMKEVSHSAPITSYELKYENATYKQSVKCAPQSSTATDYARGATITKRLKDAEINVDKLNGEISLEVTMREELGNKVTDNSNSINLLESSVASEVIERISMGDDILEQLTGQLLLTKNEFQISFEELRASGEATSDELEGVKAYFKFNNNGLEIGKTTSPFRVILSEEELAFMENGNKVAYMSGKTLYITSATVLSSIRLGRHIFEESPFNSNRTIVRKV